MSSVARIMKGISVARNMGLRYITFRSAFELKRRTGLLKTRFPVAGEFKRYISLDEWKSQTTRFFFSGKDSLTFPRHADERLAERIKQLKAGKMAFFNGPVFELGTDVNWMLNPDSGFQYNGEQHWTEVNDYSRESGDIKFVWEKARFAFLYDIIRYDYHFGEDCVAWVFDEILSWIRHNKVNCGPHYKCSQEISLRVLNWTFALHYYRDSSLLTPEIFDEIQFAIYWQLHHVFENINFSRIAVRNNHAITETLALYLGGLLYPGLPNAATWKAKGKRWFEQEIRYQIYPDGTFLQFSMNYHRVVVQLLTWGLQLASLNGEQFDKDVTDRASKSLLFLRACMNEENGHLPNYGANDGALFFPLSQQHYRDYRPQLQALAVLLGKDADIPVQYEDLCWYGLADRKTTQKVLTPGQALYAFEDGGYYLCREAGTLTFLRCGNHKDRPSQADNLHLDIWQHGENVLLDAGSYKYNTDEATLRYFMGTASHNTVMLGDYDQMEKGPRFIWYNWTQRIEARVYETEDAYVLEGTIAAFRHVGKEIAHKRTVKKYKGRAEWQVTDELLHAPSQLPMHQLWHTKSADKLVMKADVAQQPAKTKGMYSSLYGIKEESTTLTFTNLTGNRIDTSIKVL